MDGERCGGSSRRRTSRPPGRPPPLLKSVSPHPVPSPRGRSSLVECVRVRAHRVGGPTHTKSWPGSVYRTASGASLPQVEARVSSMRRRRTRVMPEITKSRSGGTCEAAHASIHSSSYAQPCVPPTLSMCGHTLARHTVLINRAAPRRHRFSSRAKGRGGSVLGKRPKSAHFLQSFAKAEQKRDHAV